MGSSSVEEAAAGSAGGRSLDAVARASEPRLKVSRSSRLIRGFFVGRLFAHRRGLVGEQRLVALRSGLSIHLSCSFDFMVSNRQVLCCRVRDAIDGEDQERCLPPLDHCRIQGRSFFVGGRRRHRGR
jgi:hypothetical protein